MIFDDTKKEPEDIFEKVEPPAAPAGLPGGASPGERPVVKAVEPGSQQAMPPSAPKRSGGIGKIILFFFVVIIILGIAGGLVWYFWILPSSNPLPETPSVEEPAEEEAEEEAITEPAEEEAITEPAEEEEAPETEEPVTEPIEEEPEIIVPVDSDNDGLTDDQEAALGTDPNAADTDGDGLTDQEEVNIWKTDPLDRDTDADGFTDAEEIENGYNPNGEGRLPGFPE